MEEGRNVFEEGNAFTMEALQQQLDQLTACQDFQASCCNMLDCQSSIHSLAGCFALSNMHASSTPALLWPKVPALESQRGFSDVLCTG